MSLGNPTFGGFVVGRASHLPSNDLPTQARRPRYTQKTKNKLLLVSVVLKFLPVNIHHDSSNMNRQTHKMDHFFIGIDKLKIDM